MPYRGVGEMSNAIKIEGTKITKAIANGNISVQQNTIN